MYTHKFTMNMRKSIPTFRLTKVYSEIIGTIVGLLMTSIPVAIQLIFTKNLPNVWYVIFGAMLTTVAIFVGLTTILLHFEKASVKKNIINNAVTSAYLKALNISQFNPNKEKKSE
jgi:hypothetical protein